MSKKKKILPELRFPEFVKSSEWEEKSLGEVCDVRDGTHDSPKYVAEGFPLITSKNLLSDGMMDFTNVNYLTEEDYVQINKRSKVDIGDILFGMIGTIGNPVIVKTDGFAIKNVALIKNKSELNQEFLFHQLKSDFIQKQFEKVNAGGILKFIALGIIRNLNILIPSPKEQQKIASCLSTLDEVIEAHSQKLELLKNHKKGLMQNLFPQEKEKVPKLRFEEFNGEWEEKTLDGVTEINPSIKKLPSEFIYIDLESVESGVLMQKKHINLEKAPSRAQRLLEKGDVIFQMVRPYQKNNFYFLLDDSEYVASTGYAQLRAFQSSEYLFQYLHTDIFVDKVLEKCTGSNYPAINASDLSKIPVLIPPTIEEQQKIASCLSALDELITAQAEKIEQLKQHKKGLMQGLFPKLSEL